jgi:hypothetical protein
MKCMCKESPQVAGALDICVTYPRSCSRRCLTIKFRFVHLSLHQVSFTTYISTILIYVTGVEALKKERGEETLFTTKIGGKTSLGPRCFAL